MTTQPRDPAQPIDAAATAARQPIAWRFRGLSFAACLVLGACGQAPEDTGPTPAQRAEAASLARDYAAARAQGNWPGAAASGDRLRSRYPDSAEAAAIATTLPEVQAHADALAETRRLARLWTYQAVPVGKGLQRTASIDSRVAGAVALEENEGESGADSAAGATPADAQLVLRDHPDWGRSAYLLLAQREFRCGSPCTLRIGFDDDAPTSWRGKQADSGKGPALFIEDEARFIAALQGAKQLLVELPAGSGTLHTLRFEVAGFDPARHASARP